MMFDRGHAISQSSSDYLRGISDFRIQPSLFRILRHNHRHAVVNVGGGADRAASQDRATGLPFVIVSRLPHRHQPGESEELIVGQVEKWWLLRLDDFSGRR